LGGEHDAPFLHAVHVPALQTMFAPHAVPFGLFAPMSWHVAVPVEQSNLPAWHGFVGTHAAPATQPVPASPELPPSLPVSLPAWKSPRMLVHEAIAVAITNGANPSRRPTEAFIDPKMIPHRPVTALETSGAWHR
jgi:hypothetical protein